MPHLFLPVADRAIEEAIRTSPLLALDFDGTLAPIVAQPDQARAPIAISRVLDRLTEFLPVAIVTGRSIADVSERLGFEPHYIVGNHGAEGLPDDKTSQNEDMAAQWHRDIQRKFQPVLEAHGITVEHKGHSLSLHYRLARDRNQALAAIVALVRQLSPAPRVIDGKCVVNLLPSNAQDKFDAISTLAMIAHCDTVIFAGDDRTDDVVFERAPPHWLTVRVEALEHHRARFHLNHQSEMAIFLQRLLRRLEQRNGLQDRYRR